MGQALAGRIALVTGASRGLGRALADAFARAGADLVLVARSTREQPHRTLGGTLEEAAESATRLGARVLALSDDLAREGASERIARETHERFGRCDVLVNNAAVTFIGPFDQIPVARWNTALRVNLLAPVALTQALLPGMLQRGSGCVLNLSSGAALRGVSPQQLPYAVSKAGLERLTTGLHEQLGGRGVALQCVRIDEFIPTEGALFGAPEHAARARVTPADFAGAMVWLVSEGAALAGQVVTLPALRERGVLGSR